MVPFSTSSRTICKVRIVYLSKKKIRIVYSMNKDKNLTINEFYFIFSFPNCVSSKGCTLTQYFRLNKTIQAKIDLLIVILCLPMARSEIFKIINIIINFNYFLIIVELMYMYITSRKFRRQDQYFTRLCLNPTLTTPTFCVYIIHLL